MTLIRLNTKRLFSCLPFFLWTFKYHNSKTVTQKRLTSRTSSLRFLSPCVVLLFSDNLGVSLVIEWEDEKLPSLSDALFWSWTLRKSFDEAEEEGGSIWKIKLFCRELSQKLRSSLFKLLGGEPCVSEPKTIASLFGLTSACSRSIRWNGLAKVNADWIGGSMSAMSLMPKKLADCTNWFRQFTFPLVYRL